MTRPAGRFTTVAGRHKIAPVRSAVPRGNLSMASRPQQKSLALGALLAILAMALPGGLAAQQISLLSPQPSADSLTPGLSVKYYYHMFRHIDELVEWKAYRDGKPGPAISRLDYRVGQGTVLTSSESDGVGAEISGLIHLDQPGSYAFSAQTNDGFRLEIGGVQVVEDPGVHADQFSDIGVVEVSDPGWYPITIHYFERKNTSTLELYWQKPGSSEGTMPLVPAEALAHIAQP